MCGHVGIAGQGIVSWDIKVFEQLLYISALRGMDGTGIFQVKGGGGKKEQIVFDKSKQEPSYFTWYQKNGKDGKCLKGTCWDVIAGHVRAATQGFVSDENAHPFNFSNIIGMHNGTLLAQKYDHLIKTDSELLLQDMNERGIIPVLRELGPKDAYALVIYDKKAHTLFFTRNDQRPLFFCFHEHRPVMYWASELYMLRWILSRNGEKIRNDSIFSFQPGFVYSLQPHNLRFKSDSLPLTKTSIEEEEKPRVVVQVDKPKNDNVVKLPSVWAPKLSTHSKIPGVYCCNPTCATRLSLVEQYFATYHDEGTKYNEETFMCKKCDDEFTPSVHVQ